MIKRCVNCGEEKEHEAKGLCHRCYVKISWKPRSAKCTRCHRVLPLKAKNLCGGCYNFVFHLDYAKAQNQKKNYGLDYELYKKITGKCVICGFDKVVDLHHLDENKKNNEKINLIGLCPNHHKMLHDFRYRKEMRGALEEKGFKVPIDIKLDFEIIKN